MNPSTPPSFPPSPEEAARLRALASYGVLDTPPEATFDRITALAARMLRVPIALVSLVDSDRQWHKSCHGFSTRQTPRSQSICVHALDSDALLVVPDASRDPRFAANGLVTGPPHIRFYAGAPLIAPRFPGMDAPSPLPRERARLGTLCVIDPMPRPAGLSIHEEQSLRDLAALVVDALLHRLASGHHREETLGRQRAESGWRRSEERYQRLTHNGLGLIYQFVLAPDGTCSFPLVGERCREVLGIAPAALRQDAEALFGRIDPDVRAEMRATMHQSASTLSSWQWEGCLRAPEGGAPRWVAATSQPQRQPDGGVLWDGVVTDVTARHVAENALREANQELESLLRQRTAAWDAEIAGRRRAEETAHENRNLATTIVEHTADLVFVKDLQHRYLTVNPAFARAFDKDAEEIIGHDAGLLFDAETVRLIVANDRRVIEDGQMSTVEIATVSADGQTKRVFENALAPLRDRAGHVTGIVGISRDVTARRHSDQQHEVRARQQTAVARLGRRALELGGADGLERLLQEATERIAGTLKVPYSAVVERDPADGIMRHRAVFGWSPELIGQPISNSGRMDSGAAYLLRHGGTILCNDLLAETRFAPSPVALSMGLRGAICVVIARRTNGPATGDLGFLGVLTIHDLVVRTWTPEDVAFLQGMANVLAAAIDRHRAEEAVEAARRDAERANLAKSEFLSRMSHELRTPLNAILGFGQLLELEELPKSQGESVEHIMRGGRHLLGLIDEVLDIARIESGRLSLETGSVAFGPLAEEAVALTRHAARSRAVTIEPLGDEARSVHVLADPMRLRQILLNLLSNAVKYNVPGGRVGIRLQPGSAAPASVRVEVWDTGRGIAPELHDRLFRPFERLGEEGGPVEGTGIGLTISQRLVQAMGGAIGVKSVPGAGSTFWVELPLAGGAEAGAADDIGNHR